MSWNPFEPVKFEAKKVEDDPYKIDHKAIEKKRQKREKQLERIAEYYEKALAKSSADADTPSLRRGAYTSLNSRYSSTKNETAANASTAAGQKLKRF